MRLRTKDRITLCGAFKSPDHDAAAGGGRGWRERRGIPKGGGGCGVQDEGGRRATRVSDLLVISVSTLELAIEKIMN